MSIALRLEQLKAMPKVELHVHLDGSVKPSTLIQLAKAQGKSLPTDEEAQLLSYMRVEERCQDLNDYLRTFDFVLPYLQTASALEAVAYEIVEQCKEQGVQYVEVRFAPQLHREQGLSVAQAYEAVIAGLQRAEHEFGVIARCIGICLRGHDHALNIEAVQVAAAYLGKGVVAVYLAGAEALYSPELYEEVFQLAQQLSLPITIHAGEAGGAENIATSIHKLGASRIGHGVRLEENKDIFNDINNMHVPLEFCPISNIQTKAVEGWEQYPIVRYMKAGIVVTINTDNLTVSNTNLTKELWTIVQRFNFTVEQLMQVQRNAAKSVFLEREQKVLFMERFEQQLMNWQAELGES